MTLKGYLDFDKIQADSRARAKALLISKTREDYEPPFGWDSFFGVGNEAPPPWICPQCNQPAMELRPYGQNPFQGICETCASKDPALAELRWQQENGAVVPPADPAGSNG